MIEKILPFLNKLIPQGIAMKGLSKLNPRIGKYLTNAVASGYSAEEALDFLRNQAQPQNEEGKRPDQLANERRTQQSNMLPEAAGTLAKAGLGAAAISEIPTVIGNLFEDEEQPKGMSREEALKRFNQKKKTGLRDQLMQDFESRYGKQQPQQPQQNGVDDPLLAALDKILKM